MSCLTLCAHLGHKAIECKEDRALDWSKVPDVDPEEAWETLSRADQERDLDDLREVCHYDAEWKP